ncbi:MAG: FAD-dependent thymidylate synthase [Coriobacteriales bacterium]|nr:FAD-dependent thymidylate synthase [Coriobacteriales bacterium]
MNVVLLYHTPDPERAVATAARLCYAPVGAAELMETMTDEQVHSVLRTIMESGHFSTLEHATYTFAVEGVSRTLTHQLVRHRLASFNQQSQRYVTFTDEPQFIEPETVAADPQAHEQFSQAVDEAFAAYHHLVELGIPAEDARYLLPNACETKITVTMNIRELLHFFNLRCCNRAQWEIRAMAQKMLELVRPTAPYIFLDAGPSCVRGSCPEGRMSCGNPSPIVSRKDFDAALKAAASHASDERATVESDE